MTAQRAPHPLLRRWFALAGAASRMLDSLGTLDRRGPSDRGAWLEPALDEHALLSEARFAELLQSEPGIPALSRALSRLEQARDVPPAEPQGRQRRAPSPSAAHTARELEPLAPPPVGGDDSVFPRAAEPVPAPIRTPAQPLTRAGVALPTRAEARAGFAEHAQRAGLSAALRTPLRIRSTLPAVERSAEPAAPVESVAVVGHAEQRNVERLPSVAEAAPLTRSPHVGSGADLEPLRPKLEQVTEVAPRGGLAGLVARLERENRSALAEPTASSVVQGAARAPGTAASFSAARAARGVDPAKDVRAAAAEPAPTPSGAGHEFEPRVLREHREERELGERLARILRREAEREGIDLEGFEP